MHQAMLAQAVLDKVVERAAALNVTHIAAVHVLLGEDDEHAEHALKRGCDLSGGQQQRAAIARALVQGAEFIIERTPGEGLRLAAMDVDRTAPAPDEMPRAAGGGDRLA